MIDHSDHTDMAQTCGPFWWGAMEGVAAAVNCPPCRSQAQAMVSAMHDLVNLKLGKPVYNSQVFQQVAQEYSRGLALMGSQQMDGLAVPTAMERMPPFYCKWVGESVKKLEHIEADWLPPPRGLTKGQEDALFFAFQSIRDATRQLSLILEEDTRSCRKSAGIFQANLPPCTSAQAKELERCIQDVKARSGDVNPWAVCQAALGCARPQSLTGVAAEGGRISPPADADRVLAMIEDMLKDGVLA